MPEALDAELTEAGLRPAMAWVDACRAAANAAACDPFVGHAWPAELLALYESARTLSLPDFELAASRQLGRLVGFDGAVWGIGGCEPGNGRFSISHASLLDRPLQLLSDYASVAACDPVTAAFVQAPHRLQTVDVLRDYRHSQVRPMRDYLQAYGVGQLMLMGAPYGAGADAAPGAVSWITAYRAPGDRPFGAKERAVFQALLPHWLCARRICVAIHGDPGRAQATAQSSPRRLDHLSPREQQVLDLIARGFTYGEAAQHMGVLISTVRTHARNLYGKLDVHNKTEAVFEARQLGLLR